MTEKISALMTGDYLAEIAARGSRKKFDRGLKRVTRLRHALDAKETS